MSVNNQDTIVALSTAAGKGAIAVIRLSGQEAIRITDFYFRGKKKLTECKTHTLHFGKWFVGTSMIDEVVVSLYIHPQSYTGEDVVEISCHASPYITSTIIQVCIEKGARAAKPGEFTQRAFLYGKLDLSQAESVADIIAAENNQQLQIALKQMRGGYSEKIAGLRAELIEFAALIELELDFSDEDVEFADRNKFLVLLQKIEQTISQLVQSFSMGNVIKHGVPVAIVGKPNVGKSTLLNNILQEEKALVSDIEGTTRDFIEDTLYIDGYTFRFIDTAGIRKTDDVLEAKGIERTLQKLQTAQIVLFLVDIKKHALDILSDFQSIAFSDSQHVIILLNKADTISMHARTEIENIISQMTNKKTLAISAATDENIDILKRSLIEIVEHDIKLQGDIVVTNQRHIDAFIRTQQSIARIFEGIQMGISGDLLAIDIRDALHHLGEITGAVEVDRDILGSIFGKFCIGK